MDEDLHPDVVELLEVMESMDVPEIHELPPEAARETYGTLFEGDPVEGVDRVEDRTIPGPAGEIPVRVYVPTDATAPAPGLVYLHGGGFVIGSIETHDDVCRVLANASERVVVSVDYRLAPEHPFPAAVEDAYVAVAHVAANGEDFGIDSGRLAVGGDSAGGTLTAVTCLLARDVREGEMTLDVDVAPPDVERQVLFYPATDALGEYPSREENAEGYFLTSDDLEYFLDHYLSTGLDAANPYAFPMNACDLWGLPPATVVTAGFDPLRDEGAAYADRLVGSAVSVEYREYEDVTHGFVGMLGQFEVDRAREAIADVAADLSEGQMGP